MAEIEKNGKPEGADITKAVISQEPAQETENLHLKTRRRLIQVGLMSLPVLMTVRSRPAFAQSLGSVDIPYGGYLVDENGELILDGDNLIPVKVNDDGQPVLADGTTLVTSYDQQLIMVEPNRRSADGTRDDTVMTLEQWLDQQNP